jgi:Mor family transcriptional regulator
MKSRREPEAKNLFDENPLDRAVELIALVKEDFKNIDAGLNAQQSALAEAHTILSEVQDVFCQMGQADLFQKNDIDSDDDFEQLKNIIGNEKAVRVVEFFAGSNIYIPKSEQTMENYRAIRQEYKDGANYRELSAKYGYTETHIRRIVHAKGNQKGEKP